jgi:hypothetical protein
MFEMTATLIRMIKPDEDKVFAHEQKPTDVKERMGTWYVLHPKSEYVVHNSFFLSRHRDTTAPIHV